MNRIKNLLLTVAIAVGLTVGFVHAAPATQKVSEKQIVVDGNNQFALKLYKILKLQEKDKNLFLSPYSISAALAMTYAGARDKTAEQMADVLQFKLDNQQLHKAFSAIINELNAGGKKGLYQLSVANALWGQKGYGFRPEFIDLLNHNYQAGLNEVDYRSNAEAARQIINAWVEKQTKDKIKELIKKDILDSRTVLVLTNAIYFKGNWYLQFEKKQTREELFTLTGNKKVKVPMMHQTAEFKYAAVEDFQVLELPYTGKDLSMVIFLPNKVDGLRKFERKLDTKNLNKWLGKLKEQKVIVGLPRFKFTTDSIELAEILKAMGMTDAFGGRADFSGMTGKKELFISNVIHKAFVEVNEEGTEAAAATAVVMKRLSVPEKPIPVFRADHPFLFLIRDVRTGNILFMGRLLNPSDK